jgi:hypothetical protein
MHPTYQLAAIKLRDNGIGVWSPLLRPNQTIWCKALTPVHPGLGNRLSGDVYNDNFLPSGFNGLDQVKLSANQPEVRNVHMFTSCGINL